MPKQRDLTGLVKAVATVVREHFAKACRPLMERIEAVEQRFSALPVPKDGERGKDGRNAFEVAVSLGYEGTVHEWMDSLQGKSVMLEDMRPLILEFVNQIPKPKDGLDGKGVTLDDVRPLIVQAVAELPRPKDGLDGNSVTLDDVLPLVENAVKAIPAPKDGKNGATTDELAPLCEQLISKAVAEIPKPKDGIDGRSVTAEEVLPELNAQLQKAVDSLPIPKDGTSVTVEQVMPELRAALDMAIKDIPVPRDGIDGRSVTLDDVRPLMDTAIATWALEFERRASDLIQRCIDRIPKPADGKAGRDAFDLEDVRLSIAADERTLTLAFVRGEEMVERSVVLTHPIYRGVWREGDFRKGDCVTFGGSAWIAVRDTKARPETDDSWKLSVKRGRDGKDGLKGDKGDRGPPGKVAA
jgi:hypothetical protein